MTAGLPLLPPRENRDPGWDEVHIRDLLYAIIAARWVFIGVLVTCLVVALAYCAFATPLFRADALVQVERKTNSVTSTQEDIFEMMAGRDSISTEIELIKSRMVIGHVVDDLQLDRSAEPRYFPLYGRWKARHFLSTPDMPLAEPVLGLSRFAWGGERIELGLFQLPDLMTDKELKLVAGNGGTFVVTYDDKKIGEGATGVAVDLQTPDGPGALFVRELVARPGTEFILRTLSRLAVIEHLAANLVVVERGRMSGILSVSLEGADRIKTAQVVNAIANAYQRQNVERRSAEAEKTLAFVNEQLPRVRGELEAAENELNRYRLTQKSADLTKETELLLQQSVALEQRRLELQQKREENLRRFTASHPVIQALDAQLGQIAGEQKGLATRVKDLPETQQMLLRLSRDVQADNALYTSLLNSAEQLQIAKAGTIGNVRIVDLAVPPVRHEKPARGIVMLAAAIVGTFLGLIGVLIHRALNPGISDPSIFERQLNLTAYTAIPYSDAQRKIGRRIDKGESLQGILAAVDPSNPAIEAIRSLRTALLLDRNDDSGNVLMLCGPTPGLGKSFVAINLAAAIAMTGRRVVAVDADLRRGHLHNFVALTRENGLSDYIDQRCEMPAIVHATGHDGLFLVPTGVIPANPSELLQSERFEKAIRWLSKEYDYVVMDSPPVLAVTDAVIVGRAAGTTLLVLKSGEHSLREIEDTLKRLRAAGLSVKGAALNQVGRFTSASYASYSGYYEYGSTRQR